MAYSKNIKIDEDGPKIKVNGSTAFTDATLSLKDFAPAVTSWSSSTQVLNKGEEIVIDGKWTFMFVRLRWQDAARSGSNDGALSIYDACSTIATVASNCGCGPTGATGSGKTAYVPSLATLETTQYTEYLLSSEFSYLDTTITLTGPTGATGPAPQVTDLYDHQFSAVLSDDILYFAGVTGGATGATANPYPSNMEYYTYLNQDKDVLMVYDYDNSDWILMSTDTDLSAVDGTENVAINTVDQASWGATSHELGNSMILIPELSNANGTLQISTSIDLEDDNMPVAFKFSELLSFSAYKFSGKIISDLDNQEINILLGK